MSLQHLTSSNQVCHRKMMPQINSIVRVFGRKCCSEPRFTLGSFSREVPRLFLFIWSWQNASFAYYRLSNPWYVSPCLTIEVLRIAKISSSNQSPSAGLNHFIVQCRGYGAIFACSSSFIHFFGPLLPVGKIRPSMTPTFRYFILQDGVQSRLPSSD